MNETSSIANFFRGAPWWIQISIGVPTVIAIWMIWFNVSITQKSQERIESNQLLIIAALKEQTMLMNNTLNQHNTLILSTDEMINFQRLICVNTAQDIAQRNKCLEN